MTCWQLGKWNPAFYCQPAAQAMPGLFSGIYMVGGEHHVDAQNRVGGERGEAGRRQRSTVRVVPQKEPPPLYTRGQDTHKHCTRCVCLRKQRPGYVITLATSYLRSKLNSAMCVNVCVFEKEAVRERQKKKCSPVQQIPFYVHPKSVCVYMLECVQVGLLN